MSTARNLGVSHTRGELLVFLDDDDRWHEKRIELQVAAIDDTVVASYCGMRTVDEHGRELVAADQHQVRDVHEVLRRGTGIILPNLMTRRDAFVRVGGFHPAFRRAQDLDLVIRLALAGELRFVDETLVDYRRHADNNTRRYRELCRSIDHVVRLHAWAATERGRADLADDVTARHYVVSLLIEELIAEHDGELPSSLDESFAYLNEQNIALARTAARGVMPAFAAEAPEEMMLPDMSAGRLALPAA